MALSQIPPVFLARKPHPRLAGLVTDLLHYAESGAATSMLEPAGVLLPLVIGFEAPFRISLCDPGLPAEPLQSFVAGLTRGPVHILSSGLATCVQVNFTPPGAYRFHGMPLSHLADRLVPLDDLDAGLTRLAARLADLSDPSARLDLLEAFVTARIAGGPSVPSLTATAWCALRRSAGQSRIDTLAREAGVSRQHLSARLAADFGLAPKTLARILRFEAAQRMASSGATGWADIAAACGYADQAHLARDWRAFAGSTPTGRTG